MATPRSTSIPDHTPAPVPAGTGSVTGLPRRAIALCLVLALLPGCTTPTEPGPRPLISNGLARLHTVESPRLQRLMHSLYFEVYVQERNVLEIDQTRAHYARHLADVLEQMSDEITKLADESGNLGLDPDQLVVFRQYAGRLGNHGVQLRQLVAELRMADLEPLVDGLADTCDGCHQRFRSRQP